MSSVELNTLAPEFELLDFKGKEFRLSDYRGKNVLLVLNRGFV